MVQVGMKRGFAGKLNLTFPGKQISKRGIDLDLRLTHPYHFKMDGQSLFIVFVIIGTLVGLLVGIGIAAVLCHFISNWLKEVPEEDRVMSPGQVWLLLIPFFNFYWNFRVYMQGVPQSFKNYFERQGNQEVGDCGKTMGMWLCICAISGLIPIIGSIVGMGTLVLLVLWMVKIHELKGKIIADRQQAARA